MHSQCEITELEESQMPLQTSLEVTGAKWELPVEEPGGSLAP